MSSIIYSKDYTGVKDLYGNLACDRKAQNVFKEDVKCLRGIFKFDSAWDYGAKIEGIKKSYLEFHNYQATISYNEGVHVYLTHNVHTACVNAKKLLNSQALLGFYYAINRIGINTGRGSDNGEERIWKEQAMGARGLTQIIKGDEKGWLTFNDGNCKCHIWDHNDGNINQCFTLPVTKPTYPKCEVNSYEINFQNHRICVDKSFHGCKVVQFYKLTIHGNPIEDHCTSEPIKMSIVSKSALYRDNIYVKSYKYTSYDDSRVGYVLKYCHKDNIDYENTCALDLCYGPIEEKYVNYTQKTAFNKKDISPNPNAGVFEGDICSEITDLGIQYHIPHNLFIVYPERTLPEFINITCNGTNHNLDYEIIHRLHVMMKSEYISVKGLYKHLDANGMFHTSLQECMRVQVYHKGSQVNDIFMNPDNKLKDYYIHFSPRHDDMDGYFNQIVTHEKSGQNRFSVESVIDSEVRLLFDTHAKEMMDNNKEKKCSKEKLCVSEVEYIINSCTEKMKFILLYPIKIGDLGNIDDYKGNQYYCFEGSIGIFSQLKNDLYIEDYV